MHNVVLAFLVISSSTNAVAASARPNLEELQLVAQLPKELPQRVSGLAYDGQKLWFSIYLGRGQYATLAPRTLEWQISNDQKSAALISGLAWDGAVLWITGFDGRVWRLPFYTF